MPLDLDNQEPVMDQEPTVDAPPSTGDVIGAHGSEDREGAMAKADLFKLANYAHKLYEKLGDEDQLEAWVQAKITKAADYMASVYHYLEYEMKFSEYGHHLDNSDTLSESQKRVMKFRLNEAKEKMKELKKSQAEKMKAKDPKKVEEGVLSGGEQPCAECGGTGMIHKEPAVIPGHVKSKVEKYNRQAKAMHAASKRLDKNNNGIPDEDEVEEGFEADAKTGSQFKTHKGNTVTKTDTGLKNERPSSSYNDGGDDMDTNAKSGKGIKTHAKAKDSETKKAERGNDIKLPKHDKPTYGMKNGEKFDNRPKEKEVDENIVGQGVYEAKKKKPDFLDMDKDGNKKESMKKAVADKKKNPFAKKVEESKPSAGLSKAKKSAVVKDAKAGKDIGKPGKSFKDVAKKAGGGEKGEKIAAAAMWKNIKETTAYVMEKAAAAKKAEKDYDGDGKIESGKAEHAGSVDKAIKASKAKETVKESTDLDRLRQLTGRLNQAEKPALVENREVDQIRALTKRLLG